MTEESREDLTDLLRRIQAGDAAAEHRLVAAPLPGPPSHRGAADAPRAARPHLATHRPRQRGAAPPARRRHPRRRRRQDVPAEGRRPGHAPVAGRPPPPPRRRRSTGGGTASIPSTPPSTTSPTSTSSPWSSFATSSTSSRGWTARLHGRPLPLLPGHVAAGGRRGTGDFAEDGGAGLEVRPRPGSATGSSRARSHEHDRPLRRRDATDGSASWSTEAADRPAAEWGASSSGSAARTPPSGLRPCACSSTPGRPAPRASSNPSRRRRSRPP